MHKKTALLATTALAALAFAAPAQATGSGWYLSVAGGVNWIEENSFAATAPTGTLTVNTDSDAGWLVAGAVGYSLAQMVTPGLRVEVEVAYRDNQVDGIFGAATPIVATTTGILDFDHSALSVLANVWYDFDLGDIRPYIGGGIGWADVEADGTFAYAGPTVVPFSFSDNGFAWQAGGGINFRISPNMQLGVGYRYFSGPEVTFAAAPLAPANLAAGELDYDSHSGTVTLTFGM